MPARRRRRTSHHRPPSAPPLPSLPEPSWFEREQEQQSVDSEPSALSAGLAAWAARNPVASFNSNSGVAPSTRGAGWVAPSSPRAQRSMEAIRALVESGRYEFGSHVESHMIEEGFDKEHCVGAVLGGRVLEVYVPPQQRRHSERFLVAGRFHLSARNTCPLHVVCEFFLAPPPRPNGEPGDPEQHVRFVTAYIPRPPEWISPHTRAPRP